MLALHWALAASCWAEPVTIRNSTRAGVTSLDAERIPAGVIGDYKACLAVGFEQHVAGGEMPALNRTEASYQMLRPAAGGENPALRFFKIGDDHPSHPIPRPRTHVWQNCARRGAR